MLPEDMYEQFIKRLFINSKKGGRTMNVGLHDNLHETK